jgi:chromosome segregation ATPase
MFWNATMPIWIGVLIAAALVLLALAFALLTINKQRTIDALESRTTDKQEIINTRTQERDEARSQRDKLNTENESLHDAITYYKQVVANQEKAYQQLEGERNALKIENGTLHEKAHAEIERLHKPDLATLPLQEAVKPPTRKKRGEQQ